MVLEYDSPILSTMELLGYHLLLPSSPSSEISYYLFLFFLFCVSMFMCVHAHVYGSQRLMPGVFVHLCPSYIFVTGTLIEPVAQQCSRMADQQVPGIFLKSPLQF